MTQVKLTTADLSSYTTKDGIQIDKGIDLPERRRGDDFVKSPYYEAIVRMEKGDSFSFPKDKNGHISGIVSKLTKANNNLSFAFRTISDTHKRIWRTN